MGTLTVGYTVKNKKATYYKCNKKSCRCNRNADKIHEAFIGYLSTYSIPDRFIEPLKFQLALTFKAMNKDNEVSKLLMTANQNEIREKLEKLEERFALGELENKEVYLRIRTKFYDEIIGISDEIKKVDLKLSNLDNFVSYSVTICSKLNVLWRSGGFELKQKLQNLVFPEGVTYNYETNAYRTCRSNSVFVSIASQSRLLLNEETGIKGFYSNNSGLVARRGIEPLLPE